MPQWGRVFITNTLTIRDFFKRYPDDNSCVEYVMKVRYAFTMIVQNVSACLTSTGSRSSPPTVASSPITTSIPASKGYVDNSMRRDYGGLKTVD